MDKNRISYLVQQLRKYEATKAEMQELELILKRARNDQSFFNALSDNEKRSIKWAILKGLRSGIRKYDV